MKGQILGKFDTNGELKAAWDAAIASGKNENCLLTYYLQGQFWLCYQP